MNAFNKQLQALLGSIFFVSTLWISYTVNLKNTGFTSSLVGASIILGYLLGRRIGIAGLSLPLYSYLIMLLLGSAEIKPFYSPDMGPLSPSVFFIIPHALTTVGLFCSFHSETSLRKNPDIRLLLNNRFTSRCLKFIMTDYL
jgi:hypothetical protein